MIRTNPSRHQKTLIRELNLLSACTIIPMHSQILSLFQSTLSNTKELRELAESQLASLSLSDPSFLYHLLNSISLSQQNLELPMATYLLRHTEQLIKISKDSLQRVLAEAQLLVEALGSPHMSTSSKMFIKGALTTLMLKEKGDVVYKAVVESLVNKLGQVVTTNLTEWESYKYIGLAAHICLCKEGLTPPQVVIKVYNDILTLANRTLSLLVGDNQTIPASIEMVKLLKFLLYPLKSIFSLGPPFWKHEEHTKLLYSEHLDSLITGCLNLRCTDSQDISVATVGFDKEITSIKGIIATTLQNFLQLMTSIKEPYKSMNPTFKNSLSYLTQFLASVQNVMRHQSDPKTLNHVEPISEILNLLNESCQLSDFLPFYSSNQQLLIQGIVFPLLRYEASIEEKYSDEPEDFYHDVLYIINRGMVLKGGEESLGEPDDDHTLDVIAIKIVHSMCRYIDGVASGVMTDCLRELENGPQWLPLILLNSIPQKASGRSDLILKIKDYVLTSISNFKEHPTTKEKITQFLKILLIHQYISYFCKLDKAFLSVALRLILQVIETSYDNTLKYVCLETLITITESGFNTLYQQRSQTISCLSGFVHPLAARLQNQQPLPYFFVNRVLDCLEDTLLNSPELSLMLGHILQCIRQIVQRLKYQYKQGASQKLTVNKCWNIIKVILQAAKKQPKLTSALEAVVSPLFDHTKNINIDEEDFIYTLNIFVANSKAVTGQYQTRFFELIPIYFQKNKHRFHDLFECINVYLYYGSELFLQHEQYITNVVQMSVRVLQGQEVKEDECCEGALILQNLVFNCRASLTEYHWTTIIETVLRRLNFYIKHSFLKANLVVVLSLCLLGCFQQLEHTEIAGVIIQHMLTITYFTEPFPSKMQIISFSEVLKRMDSPLIKQHYFQIFDSAVTLTRVSQYNSEKEEDSDEEDELNVFNEETLGYRQLIKRFQSPMTALDEFQSIKSVLLLLKTNHPQLFSEVVASMPEEKKNFLRSVLQIERMENNEHRSILRVRRT